MTEKFIPEVGQECELFDHLNEVWNRVLITAIGEEFCLVRWGRQAENRVSLSAKFRPIQPAAEKYRDEQLEKLLSIKKDGLTIIHASVVDALIDAGVRVVDKTKGEIVARKLSDRESERIAGEAGVKGWTYSHVVEAVERAMNVESCDV